MKAVMQYLNRVCYTFGGATFLPDTDGNLQSVNSWDSESVGIALEAIRSVLDTSIRLSITDVRLAGGFIEMKLIGAISYVPLLLHGRPNTRGLHTITVYTSARPLADKKYLPSIVSLSGYNKLMVAMNCGNFCSM